jgi:hypothetical protein
MVAPRSKMGMGSIGAAPSSSSNSLPAPLHPKSNSNPHQMMMMSPEYRDALKVLSDETMRAACRLVLSERDYQPRQEGDTGPSDQEQLLALYAKVKRAAEIVEREAPDEDEAATASAAAAAAAAALASRGVPSLPSIPAARAAASAASMAPASMLKPSKVLSKTAMLSSQRAGGIVGRIHPGLPPGAGLKRAPLHRETSDGSGGNASSMPGAASASAPATAAPMYARMTGQKLSTKKPKAAPHVGPTMAGGASGSGGSGATRSSPPDHSSSSAGGAIAANMEAPPPSALDFLAKLNKEPPPPAATPVAQKDRAKPPPSSSPPSSALGKRGATSASASKSHPKKSKGETDESEQEDDDNNNDDPDPDADEDASPSSSTTSSRLRKRSTSPTLPDADASHRTPPTRTQPTRASRRNA